MIRTKDKVFFDTDCLSAFLWVDEVDALFSLFGDCIVLPRSVYNEIVCVGKFKFYVDNCIRKGKMSIADIEYGSDEMKVFMKLMSDKHYKKFGDGEAEVISLAVCSSKEMASNNLSDVAKYVDYYHLNNYTVPDLFNLLLENNIKTLCAVENIWAKMLKRRIFLPADSYSSYLKISKVKKSQA